MTAEVAPGAGGRAAGGMRRAMQIAMQKASGPQCLMKLGR